MTMNINGFDFHPYDQEQMEHIRRHFDCSRPGSCFDTDVFLGPCALIDYVLRDHKELMDTYEGSRMEIERDLPFYVGRDGLIPLRDIPEGAEISEMPRGGFEYPVKIVRGVRRRPTKHLVIVMSPLEGKHVFETIYPGKHAPRIPVSGRKLIEFGYDGGELEEQMKLQELYAAFWDRHALIQE